MKAKAIVMLVCLLTLSVCAEQFSYAANGTEKRFIILENEFLKLRIDSPNLGGIISSMVYKPSWREMTGESGEKGGGLFRDRIRPVSNLWNELTYEVELVVNTDEIATALVKSSPLDSEMDKSITEQNQGLEVRKYYTLRKGQATIEVKWEIINRGNESVNNIVPWVWCNVIPDRQANYYMPTEKEGIFKIAGGPGRNPSRNWIGAIDIDDNISVVFVADYKELITEYAWLSNRTCTLEWLYDSFDLAPCESWSTVYYANILPMDGEYALAFGSPEISVGVKNWKLYKGRENKIEIVENKPLARMLYYNVDLDSEIPSELYQMVAEVLAYVYGLKNKMS